VTSAGREASLKLLSRQSAVSVTIESIEPEARGKLLSGDGAIAVTVEELEELTAA
jgi:hypothetical protein